MSDYELIWDFLREFFNFERYVTAIARIKDAIAPDSAYRKKWLDVVAVIRQRRLSPGQPLSLVQDGANQVLDDNSDDEAYRWLEQVTHNVERKDGLIDEY